MKTLSLDYIYKSTSCNLASNRICKLNEFNSIQKANSIRDSIANSMQQQLAKFVTNYEPLFFLRFKFLKP